MSSQEQEYHHSLGQRLLLIILVAVLISTIQYIFSDNFIWKDPVLNLIYTFVYWQGNYKFSCYIEEKYSNLENTAKKFGIYLSFAFILAAVVSLLVNFIFYGFYFEFERIFSDFLIGFGVTLLISFIYATFSYSELLKQSIREKETLKRSHIENELKVLSDQVNPHFLFNSLNTLMSLIPEDQDLAVEFTRKFSDVYRYVLQSKDKDLVSLQEEVDFAEKFIFLMKIRYGENLLIKQEIEPCHLNLKMPCLALQMVIENATKHNTISQAKSLTIQILSEKNDYIIVSNNINPKLTPENGTGTGLENIRRRYAYYSDKKMEIIQSAEQFKVKLPLLQVDAYEIDHH
ncbi:MAG: sensor histidine kinase [Candidatus Cyclobacteriaceae bacterium M3_2C_046]